MQRDWIAALKYIFAITAVTGIVAVGACAQTIQAWDFDSTRNFDPQTVSAGWSYEHSINNWVSPRTVTEAYFDLTYQMAQYNDGWAWFVGATDTGKTQWWLLGELKSSSTSITDSFVVPDVALNYLGSHGKLVIKFREDPDGASSSDSINLEKTRLYGNYAAIPEFGSLSLAVMGLAPIALAIKRRRKTHIL